ncbi:MAG: SIS domain-containing protein [Candidatus Omnitrophota bacterium]|nr:SIS domain-containing protein [Candidatus Omnitrophota bacterium]
MRKIAKDYYQNLLNLIQAVKVTDKNGKALDFYEGIEETAALIVKKGAAGNKLIFIGNGASAAISSHIATDFWKNGGIKAIAFNDASLLTCVSNDFGYRYVFSKPIEMFSETGDILIAISSSGRSENILLGAKSAKKKGCRIVTLSGFDKNNPLRKLGDVNFYVSSASYGHVEVVHHSICHCLVDMIIEKKNG